MRGAASPAATAPVRSAGPRSTTEALGEWLRSRAWTLATAAAAAGWSVAVFAVLRERYLDFRLSRYDLGNMVQAVWSTAQGRPLEVTNGATGEQLVRLGLHVDPILAALAPLWMVAPSPLTLIAVQTCAVALGALPVLWLGRRHLRSESAAGLLAAAYLLYPWTAWAVMDAVHPVTLAVPLLLFAIWFVDTGRLWPFALCVAGIAATGELMALLVAGLGVWYALARGRRREGLLVAAAAGGWTACALLVVVPAFSGGSSVFYGAFDHVGGSPWGLLRTLATDPIRLADAATEGRDLIYLLALSAPLGGLFLLAPGLTAVAAPQLAVNVLSGFSATTYPQLHYVSAIVPILFAATALGLARLPPAVHTRGAVAVATLCLAGSLAAGPWPGRLGGAPEWWRQPAGTERVEALRRAVTLVPDEVPVAATNAAGSHLAARRYLYSVPVLGRASWVLIDRSDTWIPQAFGGREDARAITALERRLQRSPEWRVVFERENVVLYRRAG